MKSYFSRLTSILGSRRFCVAVIIFFIFEAVWIALSAAYPQAFDEDFHFGIIKIYSHYWLPFLSSQPPNANSFGAVARDPSYLYHYLMSFPYRLFAVFVHNQTSQIIFLRLINVGLFTSGIVLFRKVMLRAGLSRALTQLSILLFALIPVAPQLAAHINYDNLLFPLIALSCILTFKVTDELKNNKPNINSILMLGIVCILTTLVKYAFLPIFLSVVLFIAYMSYQNYRGQWSKLPKNIWESYKRQSKLISISLAILLAISVGLFAQRDIVNLIKYHAIEPDCSAVLSVKQCSAYSVWDSSYLWHQQVVANTGKTAYDNPIIYTGLWIYYMWFRLFFAVSGVTNNYTNYPPLPLPSAAAALLAIGGFLVIIKWRKKVFNKNPYFGFFLIASVFYLGALWIDGYSQYKYTNVMVLENGRYLLPVLLLIAAMAGQAFSYELKKAAIWKSVLTIAVIVFFLEGGGVLTFITRSDPSWDWPSSSVVKVNNAARRITKPVIIKGSKNYSTNMWLFN
jgi:hypothetical protein